MSTNPNDSETIQQRRERILQAQAARQRAREEEIARQEAEFAAEMERIEAEEKIAREAEEKAAREAEEKRKAEEQRIEEERRREEEKRIAEERRRKQEALVEARKQEEKQRRAEERAAEDLEKRRKHTTKLHRGIDVEVPVPPSGSRRKIFKSKAVISDDSDEEGDGKSKESAPRGVKRKRTIKMIAKGDSNSVPEGESDPIPGQVENSEPSQPRSACTRCVMIGRPSECRPQSTRRQAQACAVCHQQRQRCSWSGDNTARRSRGKRVKLDDEVYEGPAARIGERRFEGPGIAEQLATIADQNKALLDVARRSLVLQQRMLHLMVLRERREEEAEKSEDEDEDEDGEGEEDEEEKEKNNEEKRRKEIREGKRRAE
ncbi:hypothetical protein F5890DRAFT_1560260 [Lentinula detonsa]|uniref:Uncharacterized protein n=1 Tax=Lentinula detonsa TaxID=2804962 RepID=A0AA38PNQ2_9AGAR|nr:hypothetical protein F5890DRAFT_1560260 [Lentinula detonsa]